MQLKFFGLATAPPPEQIKNYVFDQQRGVGQVPHNVDVLYYGVVVYLKPATFLGLVPAKQPEPTPQYLASLRQAMLQSGGVGSPFLDLKPDESGSGAMVVGHEGRGRMLVLQQDQPDFPVPVHIFVRNLRGRDFTNHSQVQALFDPIVPEDGGPPQHIPLGRVVLAKL